MRQEFWLPILLVILALACPTIVQAQQAEVATHQGNAIEDLDQLHDRSEKGDAVAQYELAERHRLGLSVVQDQAKAIELYERSAGQRLRGGAIPPGRALRRRRGPGAGSWQSG